ncbi:MAG: hypothetical protein ACHREM_20835 [Polyangiales bacterium]
MSTGGDRLELHLVDPAVGVVRLLEWDTHGLHLVAAKSFPPGARIGLQLVPSTGDRDAKLGFRLKVHRCRRDERGDFVISGALLDLRREASEALRGLLTPRSTTP